MTVRDLMLLLEKHDPETPILFLGPDYASGSWFDAEEVEQAFGKRYLKTYEWTSEREWDVHCEEGEPGTVKVLLLS